MLNCISHLDDQSASRPVQITLENIMVVNRQNLSINNAVISKQFHFELDLFLDVINVEKK